jgi:hypothetical protein
MRPDRLLWLVALVFVAIWVLLVTWAFRAYAHDAAHPEWNPWLMQQRNQRDWVCCNDEDVLVLADNEWRTVGDHYEVLRDGRWEPVPAWAMTTTGDNITGGALLWVLDGQIRCFKPGTFY